MQTARQILFHLCSTAAASTRACSPSIRRAYIDVRAVLDASLRLNLPIHCLKQLKDGLQARIPSSPAPDRSTDRRASAHQLRLRLFLLTSPEMAEGAKMIVAAVESSSARLISSEALVTKGMRMQEISIRPFRPQTHSCCTCDSSVD